MFFTRLILPPFGQKEEEEEEEEEEEDTVFQISLLCRPTVYLTYF